MRVFWGEWANRYGNKFYVNDRGGPDLASLDAIRMLMRCMKADRNFRTLPSIGRDQEIICASCATVAGIVAGTASRTGGKKFSTTWVLLFSPLWEALIVSFELGPVVVREGWSSMSTLGNLALFAGTAVRAWWYVPIRLREYDPKEKSAI